MKTITMKTLAAGIVVATLLFTSCKKDRTCTCSSTSTTVGGGSTFTGNPDNSVQTLTKVSKKDAQTICVSTSDVSTQTYGGNVYTTTTAKTCTLK